jgi:hypothetical protein
MAKRKLTKVCTLRDHSVSPQSGAVEVAVTNPGYDRPTIFTFSVDRDPIGNPPIFLVDKCSVPKDYAHSREEGLDKAYELAVTFAREYAETHGLSFEDITSRARESGLASA